MSWPRKPGNGAHLSRKGLKGTLKYLKILKKKKKRILSQSLIVSRKIFYTMYISGKYKLRARVELVRKEEGEEEKRWKIEA